jgi:hypothetical protein
MAGMVPKPGLANKSFALIVHLKDKALNSLTISSVLTRRHIPVVSSALHSKMS